MIAYQYEALKLSDKSRVQGTINADTERHARELLREMDLYPTQIKPFKLKAPGDQKAKAKTPSAFDAWIAEKTAHIGLQEKITFTQNLEIMVRSGIPITEALMYMENYMDNVKFKRLVNNIRLDILSGSSFSKALSKQKKIFNDTYVSIVQAGEASGELETVLKRLADMLIAEASLRKKVISALVYPAVVIAIVIIVLIIMFTFVIPTFTNMYSKLGVKLPMITQVMVGISEFLRHFWYIALTVTIGGTIGGRQFAASKTGKAFIDKTMLKIPVVAPLVSSVAISHFISTLYVSFAAGLPITDCMLMACQTVTHTTIRQALDEVNIKIQGGQRLAAAMGEADVLPAMILIMVSTGEEAGSLDEMLTHCLDYLAGEVNQRVDILMSLMEPVLLVVLGVIVGCMALSIYLPLFSMYEHIH